MKPTSRTTLEDRILLGNGLSIVEPDSPLLRKALKQQDYSWIRLTHITADIEKFNRLAPHKLKEVSKEDLLLSSPDEPQFVIPDEYKQLDVEQYLEPLWMKYCETIEGGARSKVAVVDRVYDELEAFESRGMIDVLRTMIYIVDELTQHNICWGVGRGSSVNSFLLYLIGVHDIDPIKYHLDWREFLRD